MLSRFDDYPIQQTPEPLSHPATSDRNFYGRYWFNGYSREGEFYFGIALGVYPNRQVMDAAFSLVTADGRQDCFRASRRLPEERTDLQVGPFRLELVERPGPRTGGATAARLSPDQARLRGGHRRPSRRGPGEGG